ncbi:MAG: response regulator [Candidatus Zixiibacteriota bacterium]|nr:MAG: response regulator [candidate division Zixibacteria bacterium]
MKTAFDILVVDDEFEQRTLLEEILQSHGYRVSSFAGADETLAYLRSNKADLVICDIRMPGMSGLEFLEQTRNFFPALSVIMMTGYDDADSVRESFRLGADEFVTKPVRSEELLLIIERVIWQYAALQN